LLRRKKKIIILYLRCDCEAIFLKTVQYSLLMLQGCARPFICRQDTTYKVSDAVLEIVGYAPLRYREQNQRTETQSEIEAREAEELRLAEEEYAAEQAIQRELQHRMENAPQQHSQEAADLTDEQ
jgi:secreted protein with Ig-like and vWFA domain